MAPSLGTAMRAFGPMTQDGMADHLPGRGAVDQVTTMLEYRPGIPRRAGRR